MSVLKLSVTTGRPNAELVARYESGVGPKSVVQSLSTFLVGVSTGTELAQDASNPPSISISCQEVAATGTITFTGVGAANDTILINGVTFTAVASGATGNQWNVGASVTASAANLVIAINASATALVSGTVLASSLAGVVTITSLVTGQVGNAITIAEGVDAGGAMTVSGARLTGGAVDASAVTLSF